jgi:tetratricopeptide (TPR) repeat protein
MAPTPLAPRPAPPPTPEPLPQLQAAIADYTAAIGLDPANATALAHRATALARVPDPMAAIKDASTALQIDPALADIRLLRAQQLVRLELFECVGRRGLHCAGALSCVMRVAFRPFAHFPTLLPPPARPLPLPLASTRERTRHEFLLRLSRALRFAVGHARI